MPTKKVKLNLVELDGNAFAIMGEFKKAARRQGWTPEEINEVMEEAKKDDYDHLLATFIKFAE